MRFIDFVSVSLSLGSAPSLLLGVDVLVVSAKRRCRDSVCWKAHLGTDQGRFVVVAP